MEGLGGDDMAVRKVHRVNQLDAVRLDDELVELFRAQLQSSLRFVRGNVLENIQPELVALLQFAFYAFTIHSGVPSPGNRYQNLRYRDGSNPGRYLRTGQKLGLAVMTIALKYAWSRLERMAARLRWSEAPRGSAHRLLWTVMQVAERCYSVLSTLNFILFMWRGVYRSLADRVVNAKLDYIRPNATRTVTFEFLNGQLLWEGFTDFVLFLAPLLRSSRWVARLRSQVASVLGLRSRAIGDERGHRGAPIAPGGGGVNPAACGICEAQPPMMPHIAVPCGHRFCYVCIAMHVETRASHECPICSAPVEEIVRDRVE